MIKLNMQLQSTVMKNTAKSIELELRKMEAQQAFEHLDIISNYLPEDFYNSDSFSIKSILSFKRLSFKSELISKFLDDLIKGSFMNKLTPTELLTSGLVRVVSS